MSEQNEIEIDRSNEIFLQKVEEFLNSDFVVTFHQKTSSDQEISRVAFLKGQDKEFKVALQAQIIPGKTNTISSNNEFLLLHLINIETGLTDTIHLTSYQDDGRLSGASFHLEPTNSITPKQPIVQQIYSALEEPPSKESPFQDTSFEESFKKIKEVTLSGQVDTHTLRGAGKLLSDSGLLVTDTNEMSGMQTGVNRVIRNASKAIAKIK